MSNHGNSRQPVKLSAVPKIFTTVRSVWRTVWIICTLILFGSEGLADPINSDRTANSEKDYLASSFNPMNTNSISFNSVVYILYSFP